MKTEEMTKTEQVKQLPTFITKNYFKIPSNQKASKRREVEDVIHQKALLFFEKLGFETFVNKITNEITGQIKHNSDTIVVKFNYEESSKRIYKTFKVLKNGNKSNRKVIEKIMNNQ
jgi:hypothetical protein